MGGLGFNGTDKNVSLLTVMLFIFFTLHANFVSFKLKLNVFGNGEKL